MSGITRRESDRGKPVQINRYNLDALSDSARVPTTAFERIDLLLLWVNDHAAEAGAKVPLPPDAYSVVFARSLNEFDWIRHTAREEGFLEEHDPHDLRLTLKGHLRVHELRSQRPDSETAFVAIWFDHSMQEAWDSAFKLAIADVGFQAVRIDEEHFNGDVVDRIRAEVRSAAFVVADVTGQRNGVYFEGGFADGLGIPVVWTCRKDDFKDVHFDTNHTNHILWDDPTDLRSRLTDRLLATIPRARRRR